MPEDVGRIFQAPVEHDGGLLCKLNPSARIKQRRMMSTKVPDVLNEQRLLMSHELSEIDYSAGLPDYKYSTQFSSRKKELQPFAFARQVSSQSLHDNNLLQDLIDLRQDLFDPGFLDSIKDPGGKSTPIKSVMETSLGACRNSGPLGDAADAEVDAWRPKMFDISARILLTYMNDDRDDLRARRWMQDSFTPHYWGGIALLLTSAELQRDFDDEKKSKNAAKKCLQVNVQDDRTGLALKLNLSNTHEEESIGRINFPSQRISIILGPLEVLVFNAGYHHLTTGVGTHAQDRESLASLPTDSPFRLPKDSLTSDLAKDTPNHRIMITVHSHSRLVKKKFSVFHEDFWTEKMLGLISMRHRREFMMCQYIQSELTISSRISESVPDDSEKRKPVYPDLEKRNAVDSRASGLYYSSSDDDDDYSSEAEDPPTRARRKGKGKVKIPPTRKNQAVLSDDAREASKLPDGLGLDLSNEQIEALMKLSPNDRKRRAATVFRGTGTPCKRYARLLETKKHIETDQEIEFQAVEESLLRNLDPDHYIKLFA